MRWSLHLDPAGSKNETILGPRIRDQKWSHFPSPQYKSLCKANQGPQFWAQIPRPKTVVLLGPEISNPGAREEASGWPLCCLTSCLLRGQLPSEDLSGCGSHGDVSFEQQMQTVVAIGDVRKHSGIKCNPHTLGDPVCSKKMGPYSEPISGLKI